MTALVLSLAACASLLLATCAAAAEPAVDWHDVAALKVEGKAWPDTENPFDRLPARALSAVTDSVRGLSRQSTGMAVRFRTNSDSIRVRWSLGDPVYVMAHMAATGTSGLDLYVKTDAGWTFAGLVRPGEKQDNEVTVFADRPLGERTYLLYLPLFNRVKSLSIGVAAGSSFQVVPNGAGKTVVFYGTSITHGGCASRPGMAYPALIGRALDCETVNLGFSGSARMEPIIAELLAELDPDAFVIDALPNMGEEPVLEKHLHLVRTIRAQRPTTPILLIENIVYQTGRAFAPDGGHARGLNAQLRSAYEQLLKEGVKGLYYLPDDDLLGHDGEGTVDGVHPTDLGFTRMAQAIGPVVSRMLSEAPPRGATAKH